jgi:hypothetical protein
MSGMANAAHSLSANVFIRTLTGAFWPRERLGAAASLSAREQSPKIT